MESIISDEVHAHDADLREVTLHIDIDSITIHVLHSVQFQYDSHKVRRHRWKKSDVEF